MGNWAISVVGTAGRTDKQIRQDDAVCCCNCSHADTFVEVVCKHWLDKLR